MKGDDIMSIINSWVFKRTIIDINKFLTATGNQFKVISSKPYSDKKGKLEDGFTYTLTILKDDLDYGCDKNGEHRDNNVGQNFDVTILNRNRRAVKGDIIRLKDFDEENSFALDFSFILRFKDYELLKPVASRTNA